MNLDMEEEMASNIISDSIEMNRLETCYLLASVASLTSNGIRAIRRKRRIIEIIIEINFHKWKYYSTKIARIYEINKYANVLVQLKCIQTFNAFHVYWLLPWKILKFILGIVLKKKLFSKTFKFSKKSLKVRNIFIIHLLSFLIITG